MNTYVTSHTLLARALDEKDPKAWDVFVERYEKYIYKLLINLGIKKDIEDVAQDVMLILWKRLKRMTGNAVNFGPGWLRLYA